MAVEHLKSTYLTNLDATPYLQNTVGEGAPGTLRHSGGYATVSASASVGSTYQLARIPTNAKVKALVFESEAQGAGKFQIGVYYSDSTIDGTAVANQGAVVSGSVAFFASDIDCSSAVARAGYTNNSGNYTMDKRAQPLWQALGLTTDPGGFFDIVATVHTTAVTTGTGKIGAEAEYMM
jgi:hypothetical protein